MNIFTSLARQLRPALLTLLSLTLLCGIAYPVSIWAASRINVNAAEGSPLRDASGCVVGSSRVMADPQVAPGAPDPYFHGRVVGARTEPDPTAAAMAPGDPAAGAASQLGPSSPELARWIDIRRQVIAVREGVRPEQVPPDAVTGSGSGLDPDISPAYADLQVLRVAQANRVPADRVRQLVLEHTEGRWFGVLGQPVVHVPALNVALGLTAPGCANR